MHQNMAEMCYLSEVTIQNCWSKCALTWWFDENEAIDASTSTFLQPQWLDVDADLSSHDMSASDIIKEVQEEMGLGNLNQEDDNEGEEEEEQEPAPKPLSAQEMTKAMSLWLYSNSKGICFTGVILNMLCWTHLRLQLMKQSVKI